MKKGTLIAIRFLDHAQGTHRSSDRTWDKPAACEVVGYVVKDEPTHYVLSAWLSVSINSKDCDYMTIVKHKGMQVKRLKQPRFSA